MMQTWNNLDTIFLILDAYHKNTRVSAASKYYQTSARLPESRFNLWNNQTQIVLFYPNISLVVFTSICSNLQRILICYLQGNLLPGKRGRVGGVSVPVTLSWTKFSLMFLIFRAGKTSIFKDYLQRKTNKSETQGTRKRVIHESVENILRL